MLIDVDGRRTSMTADILDNLVDIIDASSLVSRERNRQLAEGEVLNGYRYHKALRSVSEPRFEVCPFATLRFLRDED